MHFPFDDVVRAPTGVLVAVTADTASVLLELRPRTMRHHGGEYSFPGGRREAGDVDLLATALRETREELGIADERIDVIGPLTSVPVLTSPHRLHPYLAVVDACTTPVPDPAEVVLVLEAPISGFFDGTYRREVFRYRNPDGTVGPATIWRLPHGPLFGASAHVLDEVLALWSAATGMTLPDSIETQDQPWLTTTRVDDTAEHASQKP